MREKTKVKKDDLCSEVAHETAAISKDATCSLCFSFSFAVDTSWTDADGEWLECLVVKSNRRDEARQVARETEREDEEDEENARTDG